MTDKFEVRIVDLETEKTLEDLGVCLGDADIPGLYGDEIEKWELRGYVADIAWTRIED
jgi:hypothetical protein